MFKFYKIHKYNFIKNIFKLDLNILNKLVHLIGCTLRILYNIYLELSALVEQTNIIQIFFLGGLVICNGDRTKLHLKLDQL
jgi:predicted membrane channel-forming protein YqfA (hemolysin III family)